MDRFAGCDGRQVAPAPIDPCDEIAFRLLAEFVRMQPQPVLDRGESDFRVLVRRSRVDPAHYETGIDKTASLWLRKHPVDIPWDDPGPLEAMLALRNETSQA